MTATGHEEEFRRLFEMEAQTRLSDLAEQAMELDAGRAHPDLVDAMFRNAHTLKGGAAVVGFKPLVAVIHELEQVIDDLRAGRRPPSRDVASAILGAVDALRDMITRAVENLDVAEPASRARAALAGTAGRQDAALAPLPRPAAPARGAGPGEEPPRRRREDARASIPVPVARLDELVRLVGESASAQLRVGRMLSERLGHDPSAVDEYRDLARILDRLQAQAMQARMVSVAAIATPLRRAVRDIADATGKQVHWELAGEDTELDRHVLERLREPLVALVRNAVDHGIETPQEREDAGKDRTGHVMLHAMQVGSEVVITLSDDGRGIDAAGVARAVGATAPLARDALLDAIFRPGVTTAPAVTGVSGRGVGLDEVRAAVDEIRGRIAVHSVPGEGTEFRISVPMTLAILRCLVVEAAGRRWALPLHACLALLGPADAGRIQAEGRPAVWLSDDAVPLSELAETLGLDAPPARGPVVVLSDEADRHALRVDAVAGQRDVVIKDLGAVLPRIDAVAGAGIEPDGSVLLVLDAGGLMRAATASGPARAEPAAGGGDRRDGRTVLVVDDALTIRELQRSILARAGYDVVTAAGGEEALRRVSAGEVDLVLTDIEMPDMDGIALTRALRASTAGRDLPIVVLSSRATEDDHRRGLEAGADAYLAKGAFDEHELLETVARLLGAPR